jgi:hypothetical protein
MGFVECVSENSAVLSRFTLYHFVLHCAQHKIARRALERIADEKYGPSWREVANEKGFTVGRFLNDVDLPSMLERVKGCGPGTINRILKFLELNGIRLTFSGTNSLKRLPWTEHKRCLRQLNDFEKIVLALVPLQTKTAWVFFARYGLMQQGYQLRGYQALCRDFSLSALAARSYVDKVWKRLNIAGFEHDETWLIEKLERLHRATGPSGVSTDECPAKRYLLVR